VTARQGRRVQDAPPADDGLLAALKRYRTKVAGENGVPPYVIFHDRTLIEIAAVKPKTMAELDGIHGIGEAKLSRYGKDIVAIVLEAQAGADADDPAADA
jgi:ATP-dependent DNA helicase RecQ